MESCHVNSADGEIHFSGQEPLDEPARSSLQATLRQVLADHETRGDLSIVFVSDEEIRDVHREFFGRDCATDVVTFPMDPVNAADGTVLPSSLAESEAEGDALGAHRRLIGEVLVSVDTALRESELRGHAVESELALYAVHGTLHLVGYDDIEESDRREMRRAEHKYLNGLTGADRSG